MKRSALAIIVIAAFAGVLSILYAQHGLYGFNVLLRRGGSFWVPVTADDPRLSDAMKLALSTNPPTARPGPFEWRQVGPGFEAAELPVMANGAEVDRILLSRIDPARFRFVVRNAPAGSTNLKDWMHQLGAAFVINGSYFGKRGTPDTPFLSDGRMLGPINYKATHGAFVASDMATAIHDLSGEDWKTVFAGAHDALVSYPLLVAADGTTRPATGSRWLANRSFVAQDHNGRIVLGTTVDAFFPLDRLAKFLHDAPLDLSVVLNLDGGPVACQGVAVGLYRRDFCGKWELEDNDGKLSLLTWNWGSWSLPVVLAAIPK
jgi:hypothetical protein